ncbi:hypothetical protein ONS95_001192 [Cadophora gregata]|uniref:uncharacterized protein n=1 Tax=Cadophora gregata TaxID=51156 RepID=UPI0026DC3F8A|nr:uncharacterized protein ONS95_001192 [Cadophora gregata]KAK0129257.1 hypothetical protein ONS95_001192 [Cadophora gregata]
MPSIEAIDENSTSAIEGREKQAFTDYFQTTQPQNQQLSTMSPFEFDKLHLRYPDDAFEVVIEKFVLGKTFQIICHDCGGRRIATKFQGSIAKLQIHLNSESHVSNVMSKLGQMGEVPIETLETKKRTEVLKRIASQRRQTHKRSTQHSTSGTKSVSVDQRVRSPARGSTSPRSMEGRHAMYELPSKTVKYKPSQLKAADVLADRSSSSDHESIPQHVQTSPSHPNPPSKHSLHSSDDLFRNEISKRFEALEESNRKKKMKLVHYGMLLGETNNKYGEIEKEISGLKTREDQHVIDIQSMRELLISGIDNLSQIVARSQDVPNETLENLEALLARDEQHESRWEELENFRADIARLLETVEEKQAGLTDQLSGLMNQRCLTEASTVITNINARIQELESSKFQLLESQNELEQDNRVIAVRVGLLEHREESPDGANQVITYMSDRIETLETARSQILAANENFAETLKKLKERVEVTEENNLSTTTMVESVREFIGPLNESIDLLNERFSAQDKHIENLTRKAKKFDEWVKYFSEVVEIQKVCIEDLQNKQVSEAKSRRSFEQRLEELLDESKEREEKMAERLKALEKKEERNAAQIALLKTYSTPRSGVMSDNERGGSSTPKSSSQVGVASSASRTSQLATGGTTTPIRPPSRISMPTSISRHPSTSTTSSTAALIRSSAQNSNASTPIRPPPSSQTDTIVPGKYGPSRTKQPAAPSNHSQLPSSSQPPKGSQPPKPTQPLVPNRKPRKF